MTRRVLGIAVVTALALGAGTAGAQSGAPIKKCPGGARSESK